jgi:hypothetical protein
MPKLKKDTIEIITYKSNSQSISFREIYRLDDKKIKIEIKSDSYHQQCYARAYVLKNDEWSLIYSIPYTLMKTPEGLVYHSEYKNKPALAEGQFNEDIQRLHHYVEKVLF